MCLTHSLNIRYKKVLSVSVCALVSLLLLYLRFEVVYNKEFLLAHTASNTRRTHVALLIGGAARSMGLPIVHNSLKRFVIDALQQNRSIQIDVILRLSLQDASSWGHSSKFPQVTHKFLRSALDTLQPVSLSLRACMTSTETICDAFQLKNARSNARTRAWDVHHILNT